MNTVRNEPRADAAPPTGAVVPGCSVNQIDRDSGGPRGKYLALLSLTALGIVYGDIGTSPLYAMRESFLPPMVSP